MATLDTQSATPQSMAKPGDILIFAGARGINKLIAWFGQTPYFHVAIYAGDDEIVEARPSGVVRRSLREPNGSRCISVLPAPGGRDVGQRALSWAETQLGAPYDNMDLVVIVLERVFKHLDINHAVPGRYSCGELVAKAWLEAGWELFQAQSPEEIMPGDFAALLPEGTRPTGWFGAGKDKQGDCR